MSPAHPAPTRGARALEELDEDFAERAGDAVGRLVEALAAHKVLLVVVPAGGGGAGAVWRCEWAGGAVVGAAPAATAPRHIAPSPSMPLPRPGSSHCSLAELAEHGGQLLHGQVRVALQVEHLVHHVKVGGVKPAAARGRGSGGVGGSMVGCRQRWPACRSSGSGNIGFPNGGGGWLADWFGGGRFRLAA